MANDKNIEPHRFKKGQTGNPNGRPVKLFSEISAEWKARGIERATPERIVEVFEYLLALPKEELLQMASGAGESYPSVAQIAAEEMTGKRKREILADMLDRAHGRATQKSEIKLETDSPKIEPITPAQIAAIDSILNGSSSTDIHAVPGERKGKR